jgi:hypothetical protein
VTRVLITFRLNDRPHSRKTDTWEAWGIVSSFHLGQVRWHAPWRKYCFFPDSGKVFDESCLKSVAAFLEWETRKKRDGKRVFPSEAMTCG